MGMTTGECLALAAQRCTYCMGLGVVPGRAAESERPCACVWRAVFRDCHEQFRKCAESTEAKVTQVHYDNRQPSTSNRCYGLPRTEYMADFCLVAKRTLTPAQHKIFTYHFLLGADWKLCCRRLQIDRGSFFHLVYRVQELLGMALRMIEPYALHPVDEYIASTPRGLRTATSRREMTWRQKPVKAPVRGGRRAQAGNG